MSPKLRIILSLIVALGIVATAFLLGGTEHENAWLYILCLWLVVEPFLDMYAKSK